MPDYGARVADKAIRRVERELRTTYGTAQRELREKLRDFNAKYAARDRAKRKQLAEGKITRQQYADWKAGQVFQQKQWKSKVREVSDVLATTNQQAINVVNDSRLDVFAENYNFSAFLGEKQLGVSFDVYNTQAVARLIQDDPQILPEWKIDEDKDYEWNAKKVNNIVQQGIIQGEGIPEITKRLCTDLCTQNENKMRMFARTAITGAQNAGRQQQMEDAAEMGIQVEKQWIATLDSRTRDWHRDRDGETVPYNEEFSGGLEYPGDPAGDPADVYNCRCTMITVYPEHAAHHEGGGRRAYAEYEDDDGEHRKGYVTENPNVYEGWSEKAYRRWLEEKTKHQQSKLESDRDKRWFDSKSVDTQIRGSGEYTKGEIDEALSLAGADYLNPGEEDTVRVRYGKDSIMAKIETDEMDVAVVLDKKNNRLWIDDVFVNEQGKGSGTKWMESVVERSRQAELSEIMLYAVRDGGSRASGYYSWARMGFDGALSEEQRKLALEHGFNVTMVSELMETPKGRAYWKEHGTGIMLTLDLKDGSESLKAFEEYKRRKKK